MAKLRVGMDRLATDPVLRGHRYAPLRRGVFVVSVGAIYLSAVETRRGWLTGLLAGLFWLLVSVPAFVPADTFYRWRGRLAFEAAGVGLLVAVVLLAFTPWPSWACALGGLVGVPIGAALSIRAARRGADLESRPAPTHP